MTRQRADDLAQLKVDIELFPMPRNDYVINALGEKVAPKFDIKKFYANVIIVDQDEMGYADELLGIDSA